MVGLEAGLGHVHPETVRGEKAKNEMPSFSLTAGGPVMDGRGAKGDGGRGGVEW